MTGEGEDPALLAQEEDQNQTPEKIGRVKVEREMKELIIIRII
jgi:hypothetical protein